MAVKVLNIFKPDIEDGAFNTSPADRHLSTLHSASDLPEFSAEYLKSPSHKLYLIPAQGCKTGLGLRNLPLNVFHVTHELFAGEPCH